MDKRISYYVGLDTETCNGIVCKNNELDLTQSLVYDIGWIITDKRGTIYKTRSFIIYETFVEMKDVMTSAYYSNKIPKYWDEIKEGKRKLVSFWTVWKTLKQDLEEFGVKAVFAHNASFDVRALNNTLRYLSGSKFRFFFPYGVEIWDTLKMSRDIFGKQKTYVKFCHKYGYMTNHKVPQCRFTAEILYRYISGTNDFIEAHTGLEDVLIETAILAYCFRQHKKMSKKLYA